MNTCKANILLCTQTTNHWKNLASCTQNSESLTTCYAWVWFSHPVQKKSYYASRFSFLFTNIDDVATAQNAKAIAAAIDSFTPTLAEEQAADPDMVKFKHIFVKKTWPLGTSKSDKQCLLPLLDNFFTRNGLAWIRLNDFERQRVHFTFQWSFEKEQCAKLMVCIFLAMMLSTKFTLELATPIFGLECNQTFKNTLILVCSVKFERNLILNMCH